MANKIVGTPGDDVLKGTKGKDIIKGKGGNDVLIGKGGNDVLKGGKGKDELKGGKGNDDLKGGKGEDLLLGNKGADDHWGGPGADIFKFKNGDGFYTGGEPVKFDDVIWDFQDGIDKIDIPGPGDSGVMDLGTSYADSDGVIGTYIGYNLNFSYLFVVGVGTFLDDADYVNGVIMT